MKKVTLITLLVLILDQASKLYIKMNYQLRDVILDFGFLDLVYVENPGMAYGFSFGGVLGKYFLSIFRIVLITFIGKWLYDSQKRKVSNYFLVPMTLIFAGAIGNLLDSMFYGLMFNTGTTPLVGGYDGVSKLDFSGYAPFLQGSVVDMIHFGLFDFYWPEWLPFVGGNHFEFFKPIFNIADSAISVGVFFLVIFYKKAFPEAAKN